MLKNLGSILLLLYFFAPAACSQFPGPGASVGAVPIISVGSTDKNGNKKDERMVIGGAVLLSPRLLLLSDHQVPRSSPWRLYIPKEGAVVSTVLLHEQDPFDDVIGWEIRELSRPLKYYKPIRFSRNPEKYKGERCFVVRDVIALPGDRAGFDKILSQPAPYSIYSGQILNDPVLEKPYSDSFLDNKLVIKLDKNYKLPGASGYPVIVFDDELDIWVAVGVVVTGAVDPVRREKWFFAVYPLPQQLDDLGLGLP